MLQVCKLSISSQSVSPYSMLFKSIGHGDTVDARILALLRCMIAVTALVTIWIDPAKSGWTVHLTYGVLAGYVIYSAVIAIVSYKSDWAAPPRILHWADVFFIALLVALTQRSGGFLFQSFFYAIFVASFTRGFREGLLVTAASAVIFIAIGLSAAVGELLAAHQFGTDLSNTLIRSGYIAAFGYMIAYCGGYEGLLMRRLALLREVNNLWHPRFGVDYVNGSNLDRLLDIYDAEMCILVLRRPGPQPNYVMYTASRDKPGQSVTPKTVAENVAVTMMSHLPDTLAAYFQDPSDSWLRRFRRYYAYDFDVGAGTKSFYEDCAALANLLDTKAFATVPYVQRGFTTGRIFLATNRSGFTSADIDFLTQASDAMSTVVENMSLVEELVTKAAEHERLMISRDLHDTTIQPYIGLKLALEALNREAGDSNPISSRISDLIEMTEMTVHDLRNYAKDLKEKAPMPGEFLIDAVQKQVERLRRFYGIHVDVKSGVFGSLKGRLAAEAFQIISEGLSNILRHTRAKNAFVNVSCMDSRLQIEIGNEDSGDVAPDVEFRPRSIHDRVQALGGNILIDRQVAGYTVVRVSIPM